MIRKTADEKRKAKDGRLKLYAKFQANTFRGGVRFHYVESLEAAKARV